MSHAARAVAVIVLSATAVLWTTSGSRHDAPPPPPGQQRADDTSSPDDATRDEYPDVSTAAVAATPSASYDSKLLEVPGEVAEDGPIHNASGEGFHSTIQWRGKCWYRVTNFCVVRGELTMFHDPATGGVRGGSLRMCNEFSQHSNLIRLKYRSEPAPAVLPGPLLTKTQGWILQFWCQDLFHMTLSLLPAFNTKKWLGDHPDVYVRIAKGKRKKSAFCRIKFGHPQSYGVVRNPKWGGDHQFPFAGNPYWPFYQSISPDPWRIHPLYKGATAKTACYRNGAIDKLYVKDMTGEHAANYTRALREIMDVPVPAPRRCGKYRVTVIDRRGRTRRLTNIPQIVDHANGMGYFNATPVALETLPISEQLRLMTNTDVLLGMHGNGITWLQFLQPGAVVTELIGVWYQPYAKLWGLKHLHSSMGNNMDFKRGGEFIPFAHNMTEIDLLLRQAKEHLDKVTCGDHEPARPSPQKLEMLYSECVPHC